MIDYYRLESPKLSDTLMAVELHKGQDGWEVSPCPAGAPDHDCDGERRITDLAVTLKHSKSNQQLIFPWCGGLLVRNDLIAAFESRGFTGYRLRPANVRFRNGRLSMEYKELVVVGWAGIVSEASGMQIVKRCPGCLRTIYRGLRYPEKLIDWSRWTGDDFFIVFPLRYTLITKRVVDLFEAQNVKSYSLERPSKGWSGGIGLRLSSRMPDDVALKYGESLGIESRKPWIPWSKMPKPRR